MGPNEIEAMRQQGVSPELCELALDGLRFRAWCNGATPGGGISRLAQLLAKCTTAPMYREAIDNFIVERARGKVDKP